MNTVMVRVKLFPMREKGEAKGKKTRESIDERKKEEEKQGRKEVFISTSIFVLLIFSLLYTFIGLYI